MTIAVFLIIPTLESLEYSVLVALLESFSLCLEMFAPHKPRPNGAWGSQPASYRILIKLTWTALIPGRQTEHPSQEQDFLSAFQCHRVNWNMLWLAGWARREGSLQSITSAPTSCGSRTVLQVPGSVRMYLDSCRTWARGRKRAVSRQTCPDL